MNRRFSSSLGFGLVLIAASSASAQQATTVQLPTFNFFTISTTVNVPDRGSVSLGSVSLGGVNSAADAARQNGVPGLIGVPGLGNRAIGSSRGGSNMSVGVTIIDLKEMDRQLLADAAGAKSTDAANHWAVRVEEARKSSAGRPTISVAEARRIRESGAAR